MADISTAVSMARVPILGDNGRISDDYIPAAIGENVTKAESAATRAETAATAAEDSASAAGQSATQASGSASAASASASQAQQSAATAGGAATSAQSAQTAAEAAKTAAAGSAQDAQQSATEAAKSAASVADKFITSAVATTLEPGSQATASVENQVLTIGVPKGDKGDTGEKGDTGVGVPEGGTPGQLLSKTEDGTAWVDPPSGNVLTGTASGTVAHAEDAYAQKPIEVRVKGKTVKNLWPVINISDGTVTTDETGLITVNVTPDSTLYANAKAQGTSANRSYTLTASNVSNASNSTWAIYSEERDADGTYITSHALASSNPTVTFTTAANCAQLVCMVIVHAGYSANLTTRVMLVEGSEAPDCFVPTGLHSVEPTKMVTAGKNLLARLGPELPYTSNGITFSDNGDGGIRISGTATYIVFYNFYNILAQKAPYITSGEYAASLVGQVGGVSLSVGYYYDEVDGDYTKWLSTDGSSSPSTASIDRPVYVRGFITVMGGRTVDTVVYPQLELGSTATAYEPPTVTTTPLPEVELRGLPDGTCDELVIKSDGTCEVERRTQLTGDEVTALPESTTEPQSPVTLPVLPAPTFNAYHDGDVPSDTTVTYERDVNIAFDNLAKQIAGTASAVAVREASTIEEE